MIDDVVGIAARIFRSTLVIDEARQPQLRAEIEEHGLERAHIAVRRNDGLAELVKGGLEPRSRLALCTVKFFIWLPQPRFRAGIPVFADSTPLPRVRCSA